MIKIELRKKLSHGIRTEIHYFYQYDGLFCFLLSIDLSLNTGNDKDWTKQNKRFFNIRHYSSTRSKGKVTAG